MSEEISNFDIFSIILIIKESQPVKLLQIVKKSFFRLSSVKEIIKILKKKQKKKKKKGEFSLTKKGEKNIRLFFKGGAVIKTPSMAPALKVMNEKMFSLNYLKYLNLRGKPNKELDKYFMKNKSAIKKVLLTYYIVSSLNMENILILGDDDLTSVGLSLLSKKIKLTVIEKDNNVINIIKRNNKENLKKINVIKKDIFYDLNDLREKFDCIILDPPYAYKGARKFIKESIRLARKKSIIILLIPIREKISWTLYLWKILLKMLIKEDFIVDDIIKDGFEYENNDRLLSSMIYFYRGDFNFEKERNKYYWHKIKKDNINKPFIKEKLFIINKKS